MNTLKEEIKTLSAQQRELKNQRKTVDLKGERTMDPSQATFKHQVNRNRLRHLFMAYGLLKGKTQEQIEANPKTPIDMDYVNKILEQHGKAICSN